MALDVRMFSAYPLIIQGYVFSLRDAIIWFLIAFWRRWGYLFKINGVRNDWWESYSWWENLFVIFENRSGIEVTEIYLVP